MTNLMFADYLQNKAHKEDSEIIFFSKTFYIDTCRNINQSGDLLFIGYMGRKRIGDMLPIDYGIFP